jgi:putative transposase
MDALTMKVREHGRAVNVHALITVGVNADGGREVLGLDVASDEDEAGWLAFLRSLTARGLTGVRLVISDAHAGLVAAIGAALPGASWQRCRTHYLRNLLTKVPKSAQPRIATFVRARLRAVPRAVARERTRWHGGSTFFVLTYVPSVDTRWHWM